ncbi:MAG: dihydrolipoamide acetyltransferase family protein [Pseudomonadota bacterium]|nr:dihydrolipoamide acetyltransferase family protein [Pseudomonadota bacterium]
MATSFFLPDLGEGLAEADIVKWYVKEGDFVYEDDPLLSVETAKALVDVPAPVTGKVLKIHVQGDTTVPTHSLLAEFEVASSVSPQQKAPQENQSVQSSDSSALQDDDAIEAAFQETRTDTATVVGKMVTTTSVSDDFFIIGKQREKQPEKPILDSPAHRSDHTSTLPATTSIAISDADMFDREPIKGARKAMADAMQKSHEQVAQVTLFDEANISKWYESPKEITTRVVAAICEAVKEVPRLNAWLDMDKKELLIHHHVNLGLAVDTEDGLFVPVLHQINRVPQYKIRSVVDEVITEVKSRTSPPDRFKRATISLSNFGAIAGRFATPMVVPPAVTILGIGQCFNVPYLTKSKKGKDKVSEKVVLPLSLSFDHRAATGGEGARFMRSLIRHLEQ